MQLIFLADVEWIESDLFQQMDKSIETNKQMNVLYDVIVSNPPYIGVRCD